MIESRPLRGVVATIIVISMLVTVPTNLTGDDLPPVPDEVLEPTPQFRMATNNTGTIVGPPIRDNETVWTYETTAAVLSSPVVHDGRLYVGTMDGKVLCLSAYIGSLVWETEIADAVESSPAIHGDNLYIGADDGALYCLNATDGTQVWNSSTGGSIKGSPAVVDGRVYVGSNDFGLHCFDALDGHELWNYSTAGWVYSSPAVVDGMVFFGSCDGKVHCANATDGSEVWTFQAEYIPASPAVTDRHVIVGAYDNRLYYLDRETGEELLNVSGFMSGIYSSPAVIQYYGGYAEFPMVIVADNVGALYFLDGRGEVFGNFSYDGGITSSPAVTGEPYHYAPFATFGTEDGYLVGRAIRSPYQGIPLPIPVQFEWKLKVGSSVQSSPFIWHRKIYVGSATEEGGRVTCIGKLDPKIDDWVDFYWPVTPEEGVVEFVVTVNGFMPDSMVAEFDGETKVMVEDQEVNGLPGWSTSFPASPPEGMRNVTVRAMVDGEEVLEQTSSLMVLIEGWDSVDVTIDRPKKGARVDGVFYVYGTVTSNYTKERLTAWWDDDENHTFSKENFTDEWVTVVDTAGLSDGKHVLHVTVSDEYRMGYAEVVLVVGEEEEPSYGWGDIVLVLGLVLVFIVLLVKKPPRKPEGISVDGEPPGKV